MLKQLVLRVFDSLKKKRKKTQPTTSTSRFCTRPCFPRLLVGLVFHTHPLRAACESQPQREPFTQNFIHVSFAALLAAFLPNTSAATSSSVIGSSICDTGGGLSAFSHISAKEESVDAAGLTRVGCWSRGVVLTLDPEVCARACVCPTMLDIHALLLISLILGSPNNH